MPPKRSASSSDVQHNRALATLSYAWVFCLIPLLLRKDSPYTQFHARQGLVVCCAWFVLWLMMWLPLLNLFAFAAMVALLAANVLAMIRAYRGERWKIPYVYDYVIVLGW